LEFRFELHGSKLFRSVGLPCVTPPAADLARAAEALAVVGYRSRCEQFGCKFWRKSSELIVVVGMSALESISREQQATCMATTVSGMFESVFYWC